MLGRSHVKVALGISLITSSPEFVFAAVVGSLLPDIDTKKSILGKYNILNRLGPIKKIMQHRGVTHSRRALIAVTVVSLAVFNFLSAAGLIIGYISHLVCDAATYRGIRFMWPRKRIYRFAKMKTGGTMEWCISTLILLIGIILWIGSFANV